MIVTITGPSGVGKTTLAANLLKKFPKAHTLESFTTRQPRPTDESLIYLSDEVFDDMERRGEFLWTAHPHGKKYGTRKEAVDEALQLGELVFSILVIDAVKTLHSYSSTPVTSFYVHIGDEKELRRRFTERGDMSKEEVENRIAECRSWNALAKQSQVPFIYLDGTLTTEGLAEKALSYLG